MKNARNFRKSVATCVMQANCRVRWSKLLLPLALLLAVVGFGTDVSHAQRFYVATKVLSVSVQPSGAGAVVSIKADAPLNRAQNWQDSEGFHLVLPNTVSSDSLKTPRGVRVRRIGNSLEILVQARTSANVSLQGDGNHISITVDRKLDARPLEDDPDSNSERYYGDPTAFQFRDPGPYYSSPPPSTDLSSVARQSLGETAQNSSNWNQQMGPASELPSQTLPARDPSAPADIPVQVEDEGALASIFSATSVFVVIALGLFGLLVSRKLRSRQSGATTKDEKRFQEFDEHWAEKPTPQSTGLVRSNGGVPVRAAHPGAHMTVAGPASLFGAYRIDQEVSKLLLGEPHRMDVLGSRAIDDRRAIETSLIKGLNSSEMDETGVRRAREALEEYGFVARQCATLLLAADPFERTSAARCLGEIKSEAALPFLLESLNDPESIVRNQAVISIGELKVPSAIGALLDIARTHSDVPSSLLSKTLSACSVEGLDFFDAMPIEPGQLGMGRDFGVVHQITKLEPAYSAEELPDDSDDLAVTAALESLTSDDAHERSEAVKNLVDYRVHSVIEAISKIARRDPEPGVRSAAITTLGSIDHESVFPEILIAMADESREVRASAARALSRLMLDRAEAYVRVIEGSDEETLLSVAQACVKSGILSQQIDRLAACDHYQAYETFALICLLAKANMNEPVFDAILDHPNSEVRLAVVHLFGCTGQPDTFEKLRELALRDGLREEVKTALLEAMYRLDQDDKNKETPRIIEEDETGTPAHFEVVDEHPASTSTPEPDPNLELGYDFAFRSRTSSDGQSEFARELQQDLDELEM
jgi:HEAT repeat protein